MIDKNLKAVLDAGYKVIPLRAGNKIPLEKGGKEKASCDEAQIEEWMMKYPDCNWGLPCGSVNQIIVIDIDTHSGNGLESLKQWTQENGKFPYTLCQKTPTGGYHLFYKCDSQELKNSVRKNGCAGVDVRGEGGQVVICPSKRTMGQYQWLSEEQARAELRELFE